MVSSIEFFQVMGGVTATSLFGKLLGTSMSLILLLCIVALAVGLVVSCDGRSYNGICVLALDILG